jgi:excisionase family DNA binding protein
METKATLLNEVSKDDFYNIVNEIVGRHITELQHNYAPKAPDDYLTRNEVAQMLRCDLSTVWSWSKQGKLNPHGIGNRILFLRSEVQSAVKPLKVE